MKTLIFLAILAVSPISSRLVLRLKAVAQQEAQKILDTLETAEKTSNLPLYLSVFDERFIATRCGVELEYATLKKRTLFVGPTYKPELTVINAVHRGDVLNFEVIQKDYSTTEVKAVVTAVRSGTEFKLLKLIEEGVSCPS